MCAIENLNKLRILRFMGCNSTQYGSMERYLVWFTRLATQRGYDVLIAYNDYPLVKDFQRDVEANGGKFVILNMRHPFDWHFYRQLHQLIKLHQINVVHAYFGRASHLVMLYSFIMRIKRRIRTSANLPLTTHTAYREITPGFQRLFSLRQRLYSVFPQKIISLSKGMEREFLSLGIKSSKLVYIHGGVDADYFTFEAELRRKIRTELGLKADTKLVGTLARLVPMKGLIYLIEAVPNVIRKIPNVKIAIVGDGPLYPLLKQKINELKLTDSVIMCGHTSNARGMLCAFDLFVLPSFSEGMSNSLMEAMSVGLPIVATDIPPNRELIEHRVNGLLVPPGDSTAIGDALISLLNDDQLCKKMNEQNRALIADKFHVRKRVEAELRLYEQLI